MKINTPILILAAFAAVSTGCNKTSSPEAPFDPVVRVAPEVVPQTRGSYTTETLKEFDLFIHSENPKYSYTNTKFTKNVETGEWEPARQMLWEGKNKGFKFLAVAPPLPNRDVALTETGDIIKFTVELVQTAESNASDLLLADCLNEIKPTDIIYFQNGKLKFQFSHALTLLKVQLTLGTEFNHDAIPEHNPISELKIDGFIPTVKIACDKMSTEGSAAKIQAYQSAWKKASDKTENCVATFECILPPQSVDGFTVNFICGGKPYIYTAVGLYSFEKGKSYILPLTVGKDEVIMGSDITASPWTDGGSKDLETD